MLGYSQGARGHRSPKIICLVNHSVDLSETSSSLGRTPSALCLEDRAGSVTVFSQKTRTPQPSRSRVASCAFGRLSPPLPPCSKPLRRPSVRGLVCAQPSVPIRVHYPRCSGQTAVNTRSPGRFALLKKDLKHTHTCVNQCNLFSWQMKPGLREIPDQTYPPGAKQSGGFV